MDHRQTAGNRFYFPSGGLSQQLLEHIQSGQIGYWAHSFDVLPGATKIPNWNLWIANGQILYADHRPWSIQGLMKLIDRYLLHTRNDSTKLRLDQLSSYAQQQAQSPAELYAELRKIGIVNDSQLQKAIKAKILDDCDTYLMGSGNAEFIEDRAALSQFSIDGFSPNILLEEANQRQTNWSRLQQYIPSMKSMPILNQEALAAANLPNGQQQRIESLVGSSQTLNSIAAKMAKDTVEIAEMFARLASMGFVGFASQSTDAPSPIMVIDDSLPILLQFQQWIEELDYPVVIWQQSETALTKIFEVEPSVIFIDINMPGISGFELVKLIRKQPRLAEIPLVILTGEQKQSNQWRAQWTGCDFLTKPLTQSAIGEFQVQLQELLIKLVGTTKSGANDNFLNI